MSTLKRKAGGDSSAADSKKPKTNTSITSFFGAPKPAANNGSSAAAEAAPKFNKEKWVAGLTNEQRTLLQLEIDTLHDSWLSHLREDLVTKEFLDLKRFLDREEKQGTTIFPPKGDIYSWSRHTPFNTVKVVILGQDPYHNHNQAHGLSFSVRPPTPAPPSLRNMYIALKKDYPNFEPPPNKGGLLTPWAERGVLLLNTCLTVRAHNAGSHANRGWERFTQKVLDLVAAKRSRGVVFMAWGTPAAKRVQKIDTKRHLILRAVHPSPLSAQRGFFDCGHFVKANEWLVGRYEAGSEVDWNLVSSSKPISAPAAASSATKKEASGRTVAKKGNEDPDDSFTADDEEAMRELAESESNARPDIPIVVVGDVDQEGKEKSKVMDEAGEESEVGAENTSEDA